MRGTADMLQRDADGLIHVHRGTLTYCPPGEHDWVVLSRSMEVDLEEGLATAHHATVELEGVPVFYTPWLRLPLDDRRRTGLLWPDFGNDSSGGLDISVPVYLNLAPNYDALYAPRYIEERGLDHELQLRYLNPLVGEWLAGGAFLPNDEKYRDQVPEGESTDRWLGILRQNGLFEERWRSVIDYSEASDVDYMRDLQTTNLDSQRSTSLLQMAALDYLGDNWLTTLRAQQFQSLADDIEKDYEELPQFTSQYRSDGTPFELEPILLAQYSNFGAQEDVVTGQRLYGEAGMSYPMLWRFGSLQPTLKYRQVDYALSDATQFSDERPITDDSPAAGAPLFNLDGRLVFERDTSVAGKNLYQTLEPRLYYLYSEEENQDDQPVFDSAELTFTYYQLFRETRFSGHDRLDDANQISAGLTTRYVDESTGRDLASASIGQIYYFEDRNVRLFDTGPPIDETSSEIAGELAFAPSSHLGLRSSMVWDPHKSNLNAGFIEGSYNTDDGGIFNLGYAYRRTATTVFTQPQTEEASASGYLPLDNNWSIFAAMNYSIEDNLSVEDMVGVEYDTCCWTVRMLQLRYYNNVSGQIPDFSNPDLERETTVQFQFLLKGMGGFGNRITNIMQNMIRGFDGRDY
jgi:LPS-assembly protein